MSRQTACPERQATLPLESEGDVPAGLPETAECEHRWERGQVLFTHESKDLIEYYCVDCWRTEYVVSGRSAADACRR